MHSERIRTLLARKMGNAASDEDLKELEQLLAQYPENVFLVEALESIKGSDSFHIEKSISRRVPMSDEWVQERWEQLERQMNQGRLAEMECAEDRAEKKKFSLPRFRMLGAAVLVCVLLLSAVLYFFPGKRDASVAEVHQLTTSYGKKTKALLPDSTIVWLNSGSRLTYSDFDGRQTREVYLEGEAFFDVKKDVEHPFIVRAGNISIRVLGTAFNVKAYSGEKNIETTLIRGIVEVQMNNSKEKKILLSPNEKLTVINSEIANRSVPGSLRQHELKYQVQELALNPNDDTPVPETAWTENKLVFVDESFSDIAEKMERWYDVKIYFADDELKEERISGIFQQEDIRQALEILQMTTKFRFQITQETDEPGDGTAGVGTIIEIFN